MGVRGSVELFGDMERFPQPGRLDYKRPGSLLHAYFITIRKINQRPFCLTFSPPAQTDVSSKRMGVTRKGATASRLGREETSQEEEAAAPLLAPNTGRRSCATGAPARRAPPPASGPSPHAVLRSTRPFKLSPKSNYASASSYPRTHPN